MPGDRVTPGAKEGKVFRMDGVVSFFSGRQVVFPERADWMKDVERELLEFPGSKNDDYADTVSRSLSWSRANAMTPRGTVKMGAAGQQKQQFRPNFREKVTGFHGIWPEIDAKFTLFGRFCPCRRPRNSCECRSSWHSACYRPDRPPAGIWLESFVPIGAGRLSRVGQPRPETVSASRRFGSGEVVSAGRQFFEPVRFFEAAGFFVFSGSRFFPYWKSRFSGTPLSQEGLNHKGYG